MKYFGIVWRAIWFPLIQILLLVTAVAIGISYGINRAVEWYSDQT